MKIFLFWFRGVYTYAIILFCDLRNLFANVALVLVPCRVANYYFQKITVAAKLLQNISSLQRNVSRV